VTDRVLVGCRADEDIPDVLGVDICVLAEFDIDLLIESVDKEVKHLLFGEFVGCLVWLHQPTKQPIHLTRFVNYWHLITIKRQCLVESLLNRRSSIERLIGSVVVVVVPEPSQPAPSAGWTPPPERLKAVDPHRHGLEPLLDKIPLAVVESTTEIETS
jgi:hypothetical protein